IDLPGPALHLEAPLYGQWKADNWPLVSDGTAANPASAALAAAGELTRRLNTLTNMAMPVGLVLAVGPFVERVTPENPENRYVRIVHPRPAALRAAIVDLVPQDGLACTAEQARAVLRTLDPTVPIQPDEVLKGEGFAVGVAAYAHAGAPALAEQATTTPMQPPAQGHKSNARGTAQKAKAAALAAAAEARNGARRSTPHSARLRGWMTTHPPTSCRYRRRSRQVPSAAARCGCCRLLPCPSWWRAWSRRSSWQRAAADRTRSPSPRRRPSSGPSRARSPVSSSPRWSAGRPTTVRP